MFLSQIVDGLMPNLVLNSSQKNSATKHQDFVPMKISSTGHADKRKVATDPYTVSDFPQNPAVKSSSCRTSDRIVPVFTSKIRTAIPRGMPAVKPAAEDPAWSFPAKSTNTLHPSGKAKPTFTLASGFSIKPRTYTPAKFSAKPPTNKVIGVAQNNPASTGSYKPKLLAQSTPKSSSTFQSLDTSGKMTPKCTSQFSTAGRNISTCENSLQPPAFPSSQTVSVPGIQQIKATTKFPNSGVQSYAAAHTTSAFTITEPIDFSIDCSSSQQQASLIPHLREEHGKKATCSKFIDKAKPRQDKPECQKRKLEVRFITRVLFRLLQHEINNCFSLSLSLSLSLFLFPLLPLTT